MGDLTGACWACNSTKSTEPLLLFMLRQRGVKTQPSAAGKAAARAVMRPARRELPGHLRGGRRGQRGCWRPESPRAVYVPDEALPRWATGRYRLGAFDRTLLEDVLQAALDGGWTSGDAELSCDHTWPDERVARRIEASFGRLVRANVEDRAGPGYSLYNIVSELSHARAGARLRLRVVIHRPIVEHYARFIRDGRAWPPHSVFSG